MPELRQLVHRRPLDVYDCYAPHRDYNVVLLGNTNIGKEGRSNVQVGKQLACDQTAVITNVRARTNILHNDAFLELAHVTTVTLVVGEMPQRQFALADLLVRAPLDQTAYVRLMSTGMDPRPSAVPGGERGPYGREELDALAKLLWAEYWWHDEPLDAREQYTKQWDGFGWEAKRQFHELARLARNELRGPNVPVIVPIRQNCSVHVSAARRAISKFAEVMEGNQIAPEPLVWIHLEGCSTRDVG